MRTFYEIEQDIKAILNDNSKANRKLRAEKEGNFKSLLLELKQQGTQASIQSLECLVDTCERADSKALKVKRVLKRQGLSWFNVVKSRRVLAWRKWDGEVKDYTRARDGTISCVVIPQGFGHEARETETDTIQVIDLGQD